MSSLHSHLARSPAEDLHTSQAHTSCAHRANRKKQSWRLASWNVRSMLGVDGSVETARQGRGRDALHAEDRKVDLVVHVLERYNIKVAALQETKWLGNNVYNVGSSVLLTAGRPAPAPGEPIQRGEGVAMVLTGPAIPAWRAAGQQWRAWSSRLISVCLQAGRKEGDHLHVLSCYAPTRAASRAVKDQFLHDLEQALAAIPPSEPYIVLGDFNARVGSRDGTNDPWSRVRGPHGYGSTNDAGEELLTFLSMIEATVCNTWFKKRDIFKQTWQHPKSRQWHCIDFAIMRQKDRGRCLDVAVKRGAECNTDHQLLCMKIKMQRNCYHRSRPPGQSRRHDVSVLARGSSGAEEQPGPAQREAFQEQAADRAATSWPYDGAAEEKWAIMRSALLESAAATLPTEERHHPDWFRESADDLKPALQRRNKLYNKWLATKQPDDHLQFRKARAEAQQAIRRAKNEWFVAKAEEAERGRFGGKKVWQSIRAMQRGRRGLLPSVAVTINDENGNPCTSPSAQQQRWRRHFSRVLNMQSQFDLEELEKVRQRPLREDLAQTPSMRELTKALGKLKSGKAAGNSNILPEMIKTACDNEEFRALLLDLIHTVWEERKVPREWADAILVPIPKKGNLRNCDNWRGIALLDVVGKVVARILQERLQRMAEEELPESQCGFRKG